MFNIESYPDGPGGNYLGWNLKLKDEYCLIDNFYEFSFWQCSKRKLEFRLPPNNWALWASLRLQIELAFKNDGVISFENSNSNGKKPNIKQHKTYWSFLKDQYAYSLSNGKRDKRFLLHIVSGLPPILQKTVRVSQNYLKAHHD